MTLLQFKKIARWSVLRAAVLGAVGIITLLLPEFCGGGVIYAAVVYIILNGVMGIIDFISANNEPNGHACTEEKHIAYLNLIAAIAAIIFGILGIIYFRYLVSILPVLLGVLLLIESGVYFLAALCLESKLKALLQTLREPPTSFVRRIPFSSFSGKRSIRSLICSSIAGLQMKV